MAATLHSYIAGDWYAAPDEGRPLPDATTGAEVARISRQGIDAAVVLRHARQVGGPALRDLTFHQRAGLLKALGKHLAAHTDEFHTLSTRTGATRRDCALDVDGGIGVLFVYASKGAKELPEGRFLPDGDMEPIGRQGTFAIRHVHVPRQGAAVQINAFNFPVWGMLEKLAPALLAGMPSVVKPAGQTAYLTELVFRRIVESGILPEGSVQLVCAPPDGILDALTGQDLLSVTGSAATARTLRGHPNVAGRAVRFNAEADSLNCAVLGPDAIPGTPEFDLFTRTLVTEMTVKAGQKCTAIRRALVPAGLIDDVQEAVSAELAGVRVGNPADPTVTMGPLAGLGQREEVLRALKELTAAARVVHGDPHRFEVVDADRERGAFLPPLLLRCDDPDRAEPHEIEAFGPVSTLLPYDGTPAHAVALAARGEGSLVGSIVTHDPGFARETVLGAAPWHGRLLLLDRTDAAESTGHGSPLPHAVHGGPGRAGGGEELGGIRSVLHHMQRTAVQGPPATLSTLTGPDPIATTDLQGGE
ncbi:phenylacetic acid degradation bifunctional protein PaaZ [Streptomyces sporangiiformans]|uniref:Phenylacetic acid degradation bifunctional protein PaaZ n=1 Tax=Streptomyces sporangiiformans TaxID=2315329 RepID=A0A505D6G3_9ACTN|nr:phenylacetic acid degradation bifunctional protein PaaZ [Streptomyces sporangiiformans]TPQ18140.1 phenylacetic acid degradation bifunctional protein PaaZ [Streptomyces sporangiiformans]